MISTYDWFIARCKAVINHSRPPEPPMRVRLHEAGHAVAGHRFGYVQQGIMLREDDTGETSQQYATGMDDDMSVRLQTEIIISMAGMAGRPDRLPAAARMGRTARRLAWVASAHRSPSTVPL